MPKITVTFADKSTKTFESGITPLEILGKETKNFLAARFNNDSIDLTRPLHENGTLIFLSFADEEGKEVFHHSSSHILAQAVVELFPGSMPTIGPAVENGFYYDFDCEKAFSPEDLKKIEKRMSEIIKKNLPIQRKEIPKQEALRLFKDNPYKAEMIQEMPDDMIAIYFQGSYPEFCRGPHLPSTGYVKAVRLTKLAGAYWHADSRNKMLQRIYGISFPEKEMLESHLKLVEEAEKRDHRRLGRLLDLFSVHDEAPGFPFFHAKGMIVVNELKDFWRREHARAGYDEVQTPIILSRALWEQSGHWDHYRNNMYFTKIDNFDFAVKPMNCPGGILIYKDKVHSYRELPLRMSEMGIVHRHELSGVLSGLFRVRAFTQDDAHIFMTEEQIKDEIIGVINLVDKFYKTFGFEYHVELSTMPLNAMGTREMWLTAEKGLEAALKSRKMSYKVNPGDGAFYGPKIDFHIKDAIGRTWQCATIQLDFAMPDVFDLTYEGKDGSKHRPVMIHRTVYGSIERFLGILIEHYAGWFPLWLAPVQVRIVIVADRFNDYAESLKKKFGDLRVEVDARSESIPKKVRDAQQQKIPLILTVGEKEEKSGTLAVRTADNKVFFDVKTSDFLEKVQENIGSRAGKLTF
jgi:threonyl-tRNA synthetase